MDIGVCANFPVERQWGCCHGSDHVNIRIKPNGNKNKKWYNSTFSFLLDNRQGMGGVDLLGNIDQWLNGGLAPTFEFCSLWLHLLLCNLLSDYHFSNVLYYSAASRTLIPVWTIVLKMEQKFSPQIISLQVAQQTCKIHPYIINHYLLLLLR